MARDRYTAVWISHSSIRDFLACPRAYFLNNVYRDPRTGHKITLMSPPLALGQAVHEVIEALSTLPVEERFRKPIAVRFDEAWKKVADKRGGFPSGDVEAAYNQRGKAMLARLIDHPGPLKQLAVKIRMDLPSFWLSDEENIILCGKIDWLEYLPEQEGVHIIDFKTSKAEEDPKSLQLPIYYLLAQRCQPRPVVKASYWYLDRADAPVEQPLPDVEKAERELLRIGREIKLARQLGRFKCPQGTGCRACRPLEAVVRGEAEFVGTDAYDQDVYILNQRPDEGEDASVVI